jgi:hypothetical protein
MGGSCRSLWLMSRSAPVGVDTRSWREEGGCYSDDRRYRWSYSWLIGVGPTIVWVGLNPGTGDREGRYRPTLQRMVDRSVALGMGRFTLVNLFAWRATKPSALKAEVRAGNDIIGDRCDEAIRDAVASADCIVVAWGAHGSLLGRDRAVAPLLENPLCLGTTSTGQPRHPLYVSAATPFLPGAAEPAVMGALHGRLHTEVSAVIHRLRRQNSLHQAERVRPVHHAFVDEPVHRVLESKLDVGPNTAPTEESGPGDAQSSSVRSASVPEQLDDRQL